MAGLTFYWFRLPAAEVPFLRRAYERAAYATVFAILNRYRVGMDPLSLCCDIPAVAQAVAEYLAQQNLAPHE